MGTWDVGSFGNDTAVDWTYRLEKVDDLSYVEAAFDLVLSHASGDEVPADDAASAVAAAEVVARLRGNWGEETPYSETVDKWVRSHALNPPPSLVSQAIAALDRIVTTPSELLELWREGDDAEGWRDAIVELRRRVAS